MLPACGDDASWERAECTPARPAEPGTRPLELDGRRALVHVPEGYDGTEAQPVVLSFHGYGSSAEDHADYADLRPVADDKSFVVVLPQGTGAPSRFDQEVGITSEADDVGFSLALLDRVAADLCVDPARVYATGQSNGAGMSAVLACRAPDRIAAIALSSLLLLPERCEARPPVLGFMGTHDLVIPYPGGEVACCGGWSIPPADETMQAWAEHDGCDAEPDVDDEGDGIERRVWTGCVDGGEVRYYVIDGGGHTWPGADEEGLGPTTQSLDASEEVWRFFRRFSLAD